MWYICTVIYQRRSPFGSRSMFDRFPLVLRYSFVRPSFVLRSVSVREARCNGHVTDKEKTKKEVTAFFEKILLREVKETENTRTVYSVLLSATFAPHTVEVLFEYYVRDMRNLKILLLYSLWSPIGKGSYNLFRIIAVALLKEAGVLDVNDMTF